MAKAPARQNDDVSNDVHGSGHITTGDATVTFEGQPVACVGDTAKFQDQVEGTIKEGGACVVVNGRRIALVGDSTEKDGTIKSGAGTIEVDEGNPFVFIGPNVFIGKNVIFTCKPMLAYNQHFMLYNEQTGKPMKYTPYRINTPTGMFEGVTDEQGKTTLVSSESPDDVTIEILEEQDEPESEGGCYY